MRGSRINYMIKALQKAFIIITIFLKNFSNIEYIFVVSITLCYLTKFNETYIFKCLPTHFSFSIYIAIAELTPFYIYIYKSYRKNCFYLKKKSYKSSRAFMNVIYAWEF